MSADRTSIALQLRSKLLTGAYRGVAVKFSPVTFDAGTVFAVPGLNVKRRWLTKTI
jgi:hypothetical protein